MGRYDLPCSYAPLILIFFSTCFPLSGYSQHMNNMNHVRKYFILHRFAILELDVDIVYKPLVLVYSPQRNQNENFSILAFIYFQTKEE